jgi:hypothetical protein
MSELVNHPSHYQSGKYECIEVLSDVVANLKGIEAFCVGNAFKYLWRYQKKNGVEDLNKAKWYLDYLLTLCDEEQETEEEPPKKVLEHLELDEKETVQLDYMLKLFNSWCDTKDETYQKELTICLANVSKKLRDTFFMQAFDGE